MHYLLDTFQCEISSLILDSTCMHTYLGNLLCLTSDAFDNHMNELAMLLERLQIASLKINVAKFLFCPTKIEYLGYAIDCQGIESCKIEIKAILELESSTNLKESHEMLEMVQFY